MKILIPYANKSEIDYYTHRQYHRFINEVGTGIRKLAEAHARTIAEANLKAGQAIDNTLQSGFERVHQTQLAIHDALLDQTQVIEQGMGAIELAIESGFEQTQRNLNEVASRIDQVGMIIIESNDKLFQGLAGLKASVDMGMMNIITQFEMQRTEMRHGFEVLANILENNKKTEARERFRDGKEAYENYLRHPDETQFLRDALDYLEQSHEVYRGNPFCHLYLGHIYQEPSHFYDLSKSQEEYRLCATYAKGMANEGLAALGFFLASWIAYVRKDVEKAIEYAQESLKYAQDRIPENYYNLAKYHAYLDRKEEAIHYLDIAVQQFDPLYTIKADADADFFPMKQELGQYFEKLRVEAGRRIENQLKEFGIGNTSLPDKDQSDAKII